MSKPMRQTVELTIGGHDFELDVTWELIEVVERQFGAVADIVASQTLVQNPPRYQVAEVLAEWLRGEELRDAKMSKQDVKEAVVTAQFEDFMLFVGAIQGAVLYSLRYIGEDELQTLTQGQDLPSEDGGENPT